MHVTQLNNRSIHLESQFGNLFIKAGRNARDKKKPPKPETVLGVDEDGEGGQYLWVFSYKAGMNPGIPYAFVSCVTGML